MTQAQHSPAGTGVDLDGVLSIVIGASEGIGAAIAMGLAQAGSNVIAAGRDAGRLEPTVQAARGARGAVHVATVDVRDPHAVQVFASTVLGDHGTPTVLVNSMGGSLVKPLVDVAVDEWDDLHHTHLRGAFLTCTAFGPAMGERGYGKIINVSSVAAVLVNRGRSVYSVAKAGLDQLTTALALEWGPLGIRVNGIAPGTTRTPRAEAQFKREPDRETWKIKGIPLGRIAVPEDMVGPALFLASPMSDYVTGHTLVVDGGWVASK